MAARQNYEVPAGTTAQRRCAREHRCSSKTRADDGTWQPMLTSQPLCPADTDAMLACLQGLPACYDRLSLLSLFPARGLRPARVPPGSRVLVSPEADALMRLVADQCGGWAARVRAVPQLSLNPHGYPHGSQDQVAEDCRTLGLHPGPLLALTAGEMARTWTFPPSKPGTARPRPVPCRRCSLPLSPSPSGKYWWPAACAHRSLAQVIRWDDDEPAITAKECRACSARFPPSWQPARPCPHEPAAATERRPGGIPAAIEEVIAALEVLRAGDGWVTCLTALDGEDAALEIFERHAEAVRLLRENPAAPEWLDGVACRKCEAYALARAPLPAGPEDPGAPPPAFSRCDGCRHEMGRTEYDEWVALNNAYARGNAVRSCRRCGRGDCGECRWAACSCTEAPHPRRRTA
jgi:hypothetical protein